MVERLKSAIDKARAQRSEALGATPETSAPVQPSSARPPSVRSSGLWSALPVVTPDPSSLREARIVSQDKSDPSFVAFDVLRTRLLSICRDRGWRRIGVTSPTKGCGKSVVSLNLAFSIARNPELRVALIDLDLRAPCLARTMDETAVTRRMRDLLVGAGGPEAVFVRIGENLAVGLNTEREGDSAELLHNARTVAALDDACAALAPEIVLFDLPPVLVGDDTIAFARNLDALLMVAAAEATTAAELGDAERLLHDAAPVIGVVLNKCLAAPTETYAYDYA